MVSDVLFNRAGSGVDWIRGGSGVRRDSFPAGRDPSARLGARDRIRYGRRSVAAAGDRGNPGRADRELGTRSHELRRSGEHRCDRPDRRHGGAPGVSRQRVSSFTDRLPLGCEVPDRGNAARRKTERHRHRRSWRDVLRDEAHDKSAEVAVGVRERFQPRSHEHDDPRREPQRRCLRRRVRGRARSPTRHQHPGRREDQYSQRQHHRHLR